MYTWYTIQKLLTLTKEEAIKVNTMAQYGTTLNRTHGTRKTYIFPYFC